MKFLISLCNKQPGTAARDGYLLVCDTRRSEVGAVDLRSPPLPAEFLGFTGLCRYREGFVAVTQSTPTALVHLSRDYRIRDVWPLRLVRDGHSVVASGDRLYIASTGTDAVVEFVPPHDECIYWQDNNGGADTIHVNSVCWSGTDLLVTAFGEKKGDRWTTADEGYVTNASKDVRQLMTSLRQPHSLQATPEGLFICESSKMALRREDSQCLELSSGYLRGLIVTEQFFCIGVSMGRQRSRSTGQAIDNPAAPGALVGGCGIALFRRTGHDLIAARPDGVVPLAPFGREVYDLLLLEE